MWTFSTYYKFAFHEHLLTNNLFFVTTPVYYERFNTIFDMNNGKQEAFFCIRKRFKTEACRALGFRVCIRNGQKNTIHTMSSELGRSWWWRVGWPPDKKHRRLDCGGKKFDRSTVSSAVCLSADRRDKIWAKVFGVALFGVEFLLLLLWSYASRPRA
jgi:hypothetical protein